MFDYHHRRCGSLVFSYPTELKNGDRVEPHLAVVQGRPAQPRQPLMCAQCSQCLLFNYEFLEVKCG